MVGGIRTPLVNSPMCYVVHVKPTCDSDGKNFPLLTLTRDIKKLQNFNKLDIKVPDIARYMSDVLTHQIGEFTQMKKLAVTLVGVLALAASGNAQGTWYTDYATWQSLVTNVQTANYSYTPTGSGPLIENGITATASVAWWETYGTLTTYDAVPINFSFSGNAFGGYFGMTDFDGKFVAEDMTFSIDGSTTNVRNLTSSSVNDSYKFLGYISDSSSSISVTVTPKDTRFIYVDSFSRANGTNPSNPGSNVAPEPASLALALTGGCALAGICIRRRKSAL